MISNCWINVNEPLPILDEMSEASECDLDLSMITLDLVLRVSSVDLRFCHLLRLLLDLVLLIFKSIGLFVVRRFVLDWCILLGGQRIPKYFSYFHFYFLIKLTNLLKHDQEKSYL
jgi:hypothetical protein